MRIFASYATSKQIKQSGDSLINDGETYQFSCNQLKKIFRMGELLT